jgi:hypothetical protein
MIQGSDVSEHDRCLAVFFLEKSVFNGSGCKLLILHEFRVAHGFSGEISFFFTDGPSFRFN